MFVSFIVDSFVVRNRSEKKYWYRQFTFQKSNMKLDVE